MVREIIKIRVISPSRRFVGLGEEMLALNGKTILFIKAGSIPLQVRAILSKQFYQSTILIMTAAYRYHVERYMPGG